MVAEEVERMMEELARLQRENAELKTLVSDLIESARKLYEEMASKKT